MLNAPHPSTQSCQDPSFANSMCSDCPAAPPSLLDNSSELLVGELTVFWVIVQAHDTTARAYFDDTRATTNDGSDGASAAINAVAELDRHACVARCVQHGVYRLTAIISMSTSDGQSSYSAVDIRSDEESLF